MGSLKQWIVLVCSPFDSDYWDRETIKEPIWANSEEEALALAKDYIDKTCDRRNLSYGQHIYYDDNPGIRCSSLFSYCIYEVFYNDDGELSEGVPFYFK